MEQVQQVFRALQAPDATSQQTQEATLWLDHFQGTLEAWRVADQLLCLATDDTTDAARIFAAQTLRYKIQYSWSELPVWAHESLRNTLLNHLIRYCQVAHASLHNVCIPPCMPPLAST